MPSYKHMVIEDNRITARITHIVTKIIRKTAIFWNSISLLRMHQMSASSSTFSAMFCFMEAAILDLMLSIELMCECCPLTANKGRTIQSLETTLFFCPSKEPISCNPFNKIGLIIMFWQRNWKNKSLLHVHFFVSVAQCLSSRESKSNQHFLFRDGWVASWLNKSFKMIDYCIAYADLFIFLKPPAFQPTFFSPQTLKPN